LEENIDLSGMLMNFEFREKIANHVLSNKVINGYYKNLQNKYAGNPSMFKCITNKRGRLDECNKYWELDHYKKTNIKIFKRTETCKDKFCLNCKKWRQAQRMKKFLPELEKYDKDLYFVTFTIPNVDGNHVKETIKKMFNAHNKLILYLFGTRKTKLFDSASAFNFIEV